MKKLLMTSLLMMIFVLNLDLVIAASSIDVKKFKNILEGKGYEVINQDDGSSIAYQKKESSEYDYYLLFMNYNDEKSAKEALEEMCISSEDDAIYVDSDIDKYNCDVNNDKDVGYIKMKYSLVGDENKNYMLAYRLKDTMIVTSGYAKYEKEMNDIMNELGYYGKEEVNHNYFIYIVLGLLVTVIIFMGISKLKIKSKKSYN